MSHSYFVANWKMHKTATEAAAYITALEAELAGTDVDLSNRLIIAPPYTAIATVAARGPHASPKIYVAAQNVHHESEGAYTGEISAGMLSELGCRYVIVGHSERRIYCSESDTVINKKASLAAESGLIPILCVGETRRERLDGKTWDVVERQLTAMGKTAMKEALIAYEPVWAIGTGESPLPSEVVEIHVRIQDFCRSTWDTIDQPVLYGGSVTPENVASFLSGSCSRHVNGVLVGSASLSSHLFASIVRLGGKCTSSLQLSTY